MREQAEKLRSIEIDLSKEHGDFDLFALFLREDAPNKWDLMISSDWARLDKKSALDSIVKKVQSVLDPQELMMLSRIVIIKNDDPELNSLHGAARLEHGLMEVSDSNFFGLAIKHAYLITNKAQEKATESKRGVMPPIPAATGSSLTFQHPQ